MVAANPTYKVADLLSHLDFIHNNPLNTRINFELGLTLKLLADEVKSNDVLDAKAASFHMVTYENISFFA